MPSVDLIGAVAEKISGTPMQGFANDMVAFSSGFGDFVTGMDSIPEATDQFKGKVDSAIEIAGKIQEFSSKLPSVDLIGAVAQKITGETSMDSFAGDMASFASGFGDFVTGINGVPEVTDEFKTKADYAIEIAEKIQAFSEKLPEVSIFENFKSLITGSSMDNFGANAKTFAESMASFVTSFDDVAIPTDEDTTLSNKVAAAVGIAEQIEQFLADLKNVDIETNKGELDKFFTGDTKTNTFFSNLATFGTSLQGVDANFTFDDNLPKKIGTAIGVAKVMAEFVSKLSNGEYYIPNYYDNQENFTSISSYLREMGSIAGDLSDTVVDVDVERFRSIYGSIGSILSGIANLSVDGDVESVKLVFSELRSILAGEGEYSLSTENFLGDLDSDTVVNDIDTFVNTLDASLGGGAETISGQVDKFSNAGSELGSAVGSSAVSAVSDQSDALTSAGSSMLSAISSGLNGGLDTSGITDACSGAAEKVRGYYDQFQKAGRYLCEGLTAGISFNTYLAKNAAAFMAAEVIRVTKAKFDQASPSKVFAEIGRYNDEGLANGMLQYSKVVTDASSSVSESAIDTAKDAFVSLSDILMGDVDADPVLRPVVDLTNVAEGASTINSMLASRSQISVGMDTMQNVQSASRSGSYGSISSTGNRSSSQSYSNDVNFTNNTFAIRSEEDIYSLANELAALVRQQQRGFGSK